MELHFVAEGRRRLLVTSVTNADGRTDAPLVAADRIEPGIYELTFLRATTFARRRR